VCRRKGLDVFEGVVAGAVAFRGRFDFCSCFEVLEHVFSPLDFLREIAAVCQQGGLVFTNTLGCEGLDIQVMWEKHRNVYPVNHINILSLRGFEILFGRAGFRQIRVTTPGRLDLDIVRGQMAPQEIPRFLRTVYARGDALVAKLQEFLARNQLSSHVWVVAEKA
jgi:SAM-dependent methyltransferase